MTRKPPKDFQFKVINSLEKSKFEYRTAVGIAKELRSSKEAVERELNANASILKSIIRQKDGEILYATKNKVSRAKDIINAFKSLNSAKYGADNDND